MEPKKLKDLMEFGFSIKNLLKLDESKINVLHNNLVESKKSKKETKEEVKKTVTQSTYDPNNTTDQQKLAQQGVKVDPITKKVTLISGKEKELGESKKKTKKPIKKNKKQTEVNPWAICHAQLGPKKTQKFERCVRHVKKAMNEGIDPYEVVLEHKILSLVEKHVSPKMKKGELMDLIGNKNMNLPIGKLGSMGAKTVDDDLDIETKPYKSKPDFDSDEILKYIKELQKKEEERRRTLERKRKKEEEEKKHSKEKEEEKRTVKPEKSETKESTETAPVKPAKPGTKTPPKTTPSHPGKNPNPGVKPSPKAEKAKENMISSIIQILKKGK